MPAKYLIRTSPGLEDLLLSECIEIMGGCNQLRYGKGWVLVESGGRPEIYIDVARLPTRVTWVLFYKEYDMEKKLVLDSVFRDIKNVPWETVFAEKSTFAVRAERHGEHYFTSTELASAVGQAINDYFGEKKINVNVHLGAPSLVIDVFLYNNILITGISLTGDSSIHRRWYRVKEHIASLKPNIAFAMILLSGMRDGEVLMDPVCGGATIPIEALTYFEASRAFCNDRSKKNLFVGIKNSIVAGVYDRMTFLNNDVSKLVNMDLDFQVLLGNPPYGLRLGRPVVARKTLENIFKLFSIQADSNSRMVLIYPSKKTVFEIAEKYFLEKFCERWVMHGNLDAWITCFRKK